MCEVKPETYKVGGWCLKEVYCLNAEKSNQRGKGGDKEEKRKDLKKDLDKRCREMGLKGAQVTQ